MSTFKIIEEQDKKEEIGCEEGLIYSSEIVDVSMKGNRQLIKYKDVGYESQKEFNGILSEEVICHFSKNFIGKVLPNNEIVISILPKDTDYSASNSIVSAIGLIANLGFCSVILHKMGLFKTPTEAKTTFAVVLCGGLLFQAGQYFAGSNLQSKQILKIKPTMKKIDE